MFVAQDMHAFLAGIFSRGEIDTYQIPVYFVYKNTQLGKLYEVEPRSKGSYKSCNISYYNALLNPIYAIQNLLILEWPCYGMMTIYKNI